MQLRLHTRTNQAVARLRHLIEDDARFRQPVEAFVLGHDVGQAGQQVADAAQILQAHHGADDEVVARRVLDLEFVLNQVPRGLHCNGEAAADLQHQAELGAVALAQLAAAGHHPSAADVARPVVEERPRALLVGCAVGAEHGEAAVEGRRAQRPAQGRLPLVRQLLPRLELVFV